MLTILRARQLRDRQANRGQRVAHFVRDTPSGFAKGAQSFGFDLLGPGPFQSSSHVAQRSPKSRELGCAPPWADRGVVVRSRRMFPVQPMSSSMGRLSCRDRWPPTSHGRIQERASHQENDQPQPGVVVAAERIGPLQLSDGGVQLSGVIREGAALGGLQPGRVDRMQKFSTGLADSFYGISRARALWSRSACSSPSREPPGR